MVRKAPAKAPKRDHVPDPFDGLPAGSCYICHELIWSAEELTMENINGQPMRRHASGCISQEVPW